MSATGSPLPPVTVRAGFASNPLDATQTWTDISALVTRIKITRGRQHVLDQFEPGSCTLTCDGTTGDLDPSNTAGAYYPNVTSNKVLQVCVTANQLTQAMTRAQSATWPTATNCTPTFSGGTDYTDAGVISLSSTAAGDISIATGTSHTFPIPERFACTLVASFHAASLAAVRAVQMVVTWRDASGTSLGTTTASGTEDASTGYATVSAATVTPVGTVKGDVVLTVKSCAGASEVHTVTSLGVLAHPSYAPSATALATYYEGGPQPIYTGYIDEIDPVWVDQMRSQVTIIATDALRMLNDAPFPADALLSLQIADGATYIWPCDDAAGSGVADEYNGNTPLTASGGWAFGGAARSSLTTTTTVGCNNTVVGMELSSGLNLPANGAPWAIEIGFACGSVSMNLVTATPPSNTVGIVIVSDGTLRGQLLDSGSVLRNLTTTAANFADGKWHTAILAYDGTKQWFIADGVAYSQAVTLTPTWAATGINFGAAFGTGASRYPGSLSAIAIYTTSAAVNALLADYTAHYRALTTIFATGNSELSGARLLDALKLAGWASTYTADTVGGVTSDFATGNSPIQDVDSALAQTPALSYLQSVAEAENGLLFANARGQVAFLDRHTLTIPIAQGTASIATFGDSSSAGEIAYLPSPDVGLDGVDLYNASVVERNGGTAQAVPATSASRTALGMEKSLSESGLLITTDAESLARAQWNVQRHSTPNVRVRSIVVDVISPMNPSAVLLFAGWGSSSALEIGKCVTLKRRIYTRASGFAGSPSLNQLAMVEGLSHEIDLTARTWQASVPTGLVDTTEYWVLNSSALDSTTVLAY